MKMLLTPFIGIPFGAVPGSHAAQLLMQIARLYFHVTAYMAFAAAILFTLVGFYRIVRSQDIGRCGLWAALSLAYSGFAWTVYFVLCGSWDEHYIGFWAVVMVVGNSLTVYFIRLEKTLKEER